MPPTPPPTADDVSSQVQDVPATRLERVGGMISAATSSLGRDMSQPRQPNKLDTAMDKHHQQRLNEARMHRQNAATYASALATGSDPQTGQPLSPEQKQQYQDWYNASWQAYTKIAGVNKDTKAALAQHGNMIQNIIQHGQQNHNPHAPGTPSAQPSPSGPPAPGRPNRDQAVAQGTGGGAGPTPPTPPPTANPTDPATAPGPQGADAAAMNAPGVRQGNTDNREFSLFKRQQDLLHQHKMEEAKALVAAKAQSGARPRPVHSGSVGILDARKMAQSGKVFMGEDGPIDVNSLDPTMGLYGMVVRNDKGDWETQYTPFSPNQRTVTVGNETYAVSPMDISKMQGGADPNAASAGSDLGQHTTPKSGTHEAPMIGKGGDPVAVKLHSTSSPSTPGIKGRSAGGSTPPPSTTTTPTTKGTGANGASKPASGGGGSSASRPLDALPPGTYNQMLQRVTPVRLAATQLFGDPNNANFKPLADYGSIVDDPSARDRVATAWNLIRAHMDDAGADAHSGDLITLMRNYSGTPGAVAESEAEKMKDTLDALKPREAEMLNRLFSTYGTVIGLRSLTKGSAAKFSAKNMEQEVPVPGMNVRNSRQFYDKLGTLAEEVNNGWKGVPPMMLTKGEREYDQKQQEELSTKAKGSSKGKAKSAPPSATSDPESAADAYIKKHTASKVQ